jgi:hypothetical protein
MSNCQIGADCYSDCANCTSIRFPCETLDGKQCQNQPDYCMLKGGHCYNLPVPYGVANSCASPKTGCADKKYPDLTTNTYYDDSNINKLFTFKEDGTATATPQTVAMIQQMIKSGTLQDLGLQKGIEAIVSSAVDAESRKQLYIHIMIFVLLLVIGGGGFAVYKWKFQK